MQLRRLGQTDLRIAPLVLGGNVFGWTADRAASFAILDAFLDAGFNAIDTADCYNRFAAGLVGGESETLLGDWMADRGVRDRVIIITKGGLDMGVGGEGLSRDYLGRACDASLRRLRTDYVDVYMAHRADPAVPIEETLAAFQSLIDTGRIRHAGCSNYSAADLAEAVSAGGSTGLARYAVVEPHYNLYDRANYEGAMEALCLRNGLGVVGYYALASGFLSGKYRSERDLAGRESRAGMLATYLNPRGYALLEALDEVAARHRATPAQVALAWVMARPGVTAPIASATTIAQLADILGSARICLSADDLARLDCSPEQREAAP
jgi:aryl-alcohol dehydrogenase-like predicted oxidoreductase